ncbi:MAG TPA: hypothetical protein VLL52_11150 [Anaerolineae bacterium]|nr:hypothetical protein [Anaerolineae bacterium]
MNNGSSPLTIPLTIANLPLLLQGTDEAVIARLRQRYQDFLAPEPIDPLFTVDINVIPDAIFVEPKPGPWVIESTYTADSMTYRSYVSQSRLDLKTKRGQLDMAPDASIENFLRVTYAWLCLQHDGLLLHSAGIIRNELGYVFFGPSGAGKTTTTRISAKLGTVVSDDLVIIRRLNGQYHLFGVPFRGDLADEAPRTNSVAPLKAIFRLRQDYHHEVAPLPRSMGIAELLAAAPFVSDKRALTPQLISVCTDIARHVPLQSLHFKRDDGFWKVIDEHFTEISTTTPANSR